MSRTPNDEQGPDPRTRRVLDAFDHALMIDEPLPPELVRRAQDLYVWRSVDAELLELLVDSADSGLTMVRDQQLQRFMAFGSEERGVHFECVGSDDGFSLEGMVIPAGEYAVRVDRPNSESIVTTDELGSFRIERLGAGSLRLTIRTNDGDVMMATPWFVLEGDSPPSR